MTNIKKEPYKSRSIRVNDKSWDYFNSLKPRDKSWNLFLKELTDAIKYIKKL